MKTFRIAAWTKGKVEVSENSSGTKSVTIGEADFSSTVFFGHTQYEFKLREGKPVLEEVKGPKVTVL